MLNQIPETFNGLTWRPQGRQNIACSKIKSCSSFETLFLQIYLVCLLCFIPWNDLGKQREGGNKLSSPPPNTLLVLPSSCNFRNISNTFSQYNIEKKVDSDEEDEDEDEDGFGPKKAAVDEDDPVARELL